LLLKLASPMIAHAGVPAQHTSCMQVTPAGLVEAVAFDTRDGLYDCAWSEENEAIVIAACGDGSIKAYDLAAPPLANPMRSFHEHKHEVSIRQSAYFENPPRTVSL